MTAALEGGEWSAARPGRILPPGKTGYPFYKRLGGPQGRSGREENLVPTGIRSRTVQPLVRRYIGIYIKSPLGRSARAENLVPTGIRSRTVHPLVSRYIVIYIKYPLGQYARAENLVPQRESIPEHPAPSQSLHRYLYKVTLRPVCTGEKSRPHRDSIQYRPAPSQSLYRLSYPAHIST